jgi:hypothetical protein
MYKFIWVNFVLYHLYNNENGEPIVGMEYQLPNIILYIQYQSINTHLSNIIFKKIFWRWNAKRKKGKKS